MKKVKTFFITLWAKVKAFTCRLKLRFLSLRNKLKTSNKKPLLCFSLGLIVFGLFMCDRLSCHKDFETASADTIVTTRDDTAFLISTYMPSILYCSGNSASSFASPASFYILDNGFGFCTGDYAFFNLLESTDDDFTTDYSTVFYLVAPNAGVTVNFYYTAYDIRAYLSIIGDSRDWWGDFYQRCLRGEYEVIVDFYNNVISGSTANKNSLYNTNNYCRYSLVFNHKTDDNLSYILDFYLSSFVNVPSSIDSVRFTNVSDLEGYSRLYYYYVSCSYIGIPADDSYEIIYDNGYNTGFDTGYYDGYNKGINESLSDISPWEVLVDGLDSFFNMRLFGSISIGTIFKIAVSTLLIGFIIKIFLGG